MYGTAGFLHVWFVCGKTEFIGHYNAHTLAAPVAVSESATAFVDITGPNIGSYCLC